MVPWARKAESDPRSVLSDPRGRPASAPDNPWKKCLLSPRHGSPGKSPGASSQSYQWPAHGNLADDSSNDDLARLSGLNSGRAGSLGVQLCCIGLASGA